ncbi:zinc transporter 6-A-like isoform X3 [Zootermopsis nevadensis]|uniref:zinc transporter 6-A-like isoform X3 n=1 Tax=Zootermopsis nevadensis TaxID=136037 RepID=UPI000B8E9C9A|nr:zinc transporter 6-A-like isoform X3 [Zootermopsis nevadensis]
MVLDSYGSWNQEGVLSSFQTLLSEVCITVCGSIIDSSWFRKELLKASFSNCLSYPTSSLLTACSSQFVILARERQVKLISLLVMFNMTCVFILLAWCTSTQSMALQAYTYTIGFNLLSLMTSILSIWVERNGPTPLFSFGYERFEVLAVFASTVLAQLGSLFIVKESIERLVLEQPEIHTGHLMMGTGVAFMSHIVVIYGCNNAALDHVIAASSSSWLQEHVSDISHSICSVVPVLSGFLLPRINPMLLVACVGAAALFITDLLIHLNCYTVDTLVAVAIAAVTFATMLPMSLYSGKVLLQTTPSHIVGQLDRCLRETLTIDGVLEFRNEHFWTLSFGKMAGSLQVRVRRDADEQLVLAHVVDRLSNLVSVLTVQVFKDEWAVRKGGITSAPSAPLLPLLNSSSALALPQSSSSNQNGSSFPYHSMAPVSYVQSSTFPVNHTLSLSSQENVPQMREPPQWRSSLVETVNVSVQHKNPFLSDFSVPSMQQQAYMNNLLISGTRTLDANRFMYQPR